MGVKQSNRRLCTPIDCSLSPSKIKPTYEAFWVLLHDLCATATACATAVQCSEVWEAECALSFLFG